MTLKQLTVKTFARLAVLLAVALCAAAGAVQVSADEGGQSGLNPSFDPLTLNYTVTVPHDVTEVTFDLRAQHPEATVTVNGGDPSTPVQLAVGENTIKIVVTAEDARYTRTYTIVVTRLEAKANEAPAVASGLADATIANQGGTQRVSLSGVFADADEDDLTITAASSAESVATVAVSNDTLTVTAKSRGTATITVTASDGEDEVSDSFTVTVKSAPVVSAPIADINELEAEASREVSLSGVFSDADGDALQISAATSDRAIVNISAALDGATLSATAVTVIGVAEGRATITVTAQDPDGNRVSDAFDVTVPAAEAQQQQQVDAVPGQVVNLSLSQTQPTRIRVEWDAPEDGDAVNSYQVVLSRDGEELSTRRPGAKKRHVVIRKLEPGASYTVSVRAKNATGLGPVDTAQITLTVSVGDDDPAETPAPQEQQASAQQQQQVPVNQPPTVAAPISDITGLRRGDGRAVSLTGVFADADGDALTITAQSSAAAAVTASVAPGGASLMIAALSEGAATITVTADDGNGGTVADSFTVSVAGNQPPTVAAPIGEISGVKPGDSRVVSLSGVFADAEGDALTLTARTSNRSVATVAADGASLTVAAVAEGAATITVTADDGQGGTVADSFTVTVAGNAAPRVVRSMADISGLTEQTTKRVLLNDTFRDADNDRLTITASSSDETVVRVSLDYNYYGLTVNALSAGSATVTVMADDGNGGRASESFAVTVTAPPDPAPDDAPDDAPGSESDSPAAEAEQEDVLVRYDTDGDGKISKAEYDAALPDLGATLTLNELIRLRAAWLASAR